MAATPVNQQQIDEVKLDNDLEYRFQYVCQFVGFGAKDIEAIHGAAGLLAPLVTGLVDAVYAKLYQYSSTWRHFLPKQSGFAGDALTDLSALTLDHPQIQFRKQHLSRYLVQLVTKPYDGKMIEYLDMVGKIHTAKAGSAEIFIPYVQINSLLGFVADALNATILGLGLDRETEATTLRAFNKLLWIQNDLMARHYLK